MSMVHKVDYYQVQVPHDVGEAFRILSDLRGAGVGLLACCGFPVGGGKAQIELVPKHHESFRKAAAKLDLQPSERERAFLIQGGNRVVAVDEAIETLAKHGVNILAFQAVSAGSGTWGMMLRVEPADYERACEALGF